LTDTFVFMSQTQFYLHLKFVFLVYKLTFSLYETITLCCWCTFELPLCPCKFRSCTSIYQCLGGMPSYWHSLILSSLSFLNPLKQPDGTKGCCYINYKPSILLAVKMGHISL